MVAVSWKTPGCVEIDRNLNISGMARAIYVAFEARYELVEELAQICAC